MTRRGTRPPPPELYAALARAFTGGFTQVRLETRDGRVLRPAASFDLIAALERVEAEFEEWFYVEPEWNPMERVLELMPGGGLFQFVWDAGCTSWLAFGELVDLGPSGTLVCWFDENRGMRPIALIEAGAGPALWDAFVLDLFRDNGSAYGIDTWGEPPDEFSNQAPDVVRRETLVQAVRTWMDESPWGDYRSLRDRMMAKLGSWPDEQRNDELLEGLRAMNPWQRTEDGGTRGFSEEERALILSAYFALAYQ